jgi:hypothetical protein
VILTLSIKEAMAAMAHFVRLDVSMPEIAVWRRRSSEAAGYPKRHGRNAPQLGPKVGVIGTAGYEGRVRELVDRLLNLSVIVSHR